MRMSQAEKERSRERIVASAARLIRERGLAGASVGEIMQAAGMTHGGFYKHFDSKEALAEAAIAAAFAEFTSLLDSGDPAAAARKYGDLYLSADHLSHPERGCPVATLGQEIARERGDLKSAFSAHVVALVDRLARAAPGAAKARRRAAYRKFSMLVGAIVIARACDAATGRAVLDAAREQAGDA